VIVASTVSSDAHLEVLQLQDAAREGASRRSSPFCRTWATLDRTRLSRRVILFPRGRSPVRFRPARTASSPPTPRDGSLRVFEPTATAVDAAGRLAEPLPDDLVEPVFLPDAGAIDLAETVRDAAGAGETDYFEKTRHSGTDVEISPSDVDVADRDVVVVDDIIATGSTMSEAVDVLQQRNVGRVFVTCVHPLLARNAVTKLSRAGVEAIYGTDTIERGLAPSRSHRPSQDTCKQTIK